MMPLNDNGKKIFGKETMAVNAYVIGDCDELVMASPVLVVSLQNGKKKKNTYSEV